MIMNVYKLFFCSINKNYNSKLNNVYQQIFGLETEISIYNQEIFINHFYFLMTEISIQYQEMFMYNFFVLLKVI